jgi:microcystin-dependent protein
MSCSNCFNGCVDIVSDKCVKYTGVDIPILGIQTGDSLSYVEQALITFLTSTLDGTGIKPTLSPTLVVCDVVHKYFVECSDLTIVNIAEALIKAICDLQAQVTIINNNVTNVTEEVAILNNDYAVGCLTGVINSSDTHTILQAVIDTLCALITTLPITYVAQNDLNGLIDTWMDNNLPLNLMKNRMVPYVAVEYYGDLTGKFDGTGAGIVGTVWESIYLCNGRTFNGFVTPDKRGRSPVGRTDMLGGAFDPAVDPAIAPNPTYVLNTKTGSNDVLLTVPDLPTHSHTAIVTDPLHFHYEFGDVNSGDGPVTSLNYPHSSNTWGNNSSYNYEMGGSAIVSTVGKSSLASAGVSVINSNTGNDVKHLNIQPVVSCFYIMYIH